MEGSGQIHAPADLSPLKEPSVLIGQEAGWVPESIWWGKENSCIAGNRTRAVQPVAIPTLLSRPLPTDSSKGKVNPVTGREGPWGCATPRLPYYPRQSAHRWR
jgi:hypothetical protein